MACEVIIMSSNGEDVILSFTIDDKSELVQGLSNELKSKSQTELNSIKNRLEVEENLGDDLDLSLIAKKISDDYEVVGEYNHDAIKDYFSEGYKTQIQQKLDYLSANDQPVKIILTSAKGFVFDKIRSHGTVFTDTSGKKVIYVNTNQDPDAIARDLNHELSHAIYDTLIKENYNDLANKLQFLYKSLIQPFKSSKNPKIIEIGKKLELLPNPREIYSWVFQDQDVYDFAKTYSKPLVDEISSIMGETPNGEVRPVENLISNDVPFSSEVNDLFVDYNETAEGLSEIYLKYKDPALKENWKEKYAEMYDVLMDNYNEFIKDGDVNLSFAIAKEITSPVELHKIPKGSLVQIPFFASLTMKKWKERLSEDELKQFFGPEYTEIADDEWQSLSLRKMHNYYESNKITPSEGAKEMVYKKYKKKAAWELVKNYPLAYLGEDEEGKPYVAVPQLFGKSKSIGRFYADDVFSYREFSRKALHYDKPKANDEQIAYYERFLKESGEKGTTYEEGVKFQDDDYTFMKKIVFGGDKSFTSEIVQNNNIKVKGAIGSLSKLAKSAEPGSFVKFAFEYDTKTKKNKMGYGVVLANGAGGFYVMYKDGDKVEHKIVSHNSVTEIFFPFNTNKKLMDSLREHELMNSVGDSDKFKELISDLYNPDYENKFILNFGYLEKGQTTDKNSDDYKKNIDRKIRMISKIKQGSIVKYITLEKGKIVERIGSFFTSDDKYAYVMPKVGNNLVRIAISNKAGSYDKNVGERVGHDFNDAYNKSALDTAFVDMTPESEYLSYLEQLKSVLKDNQSILENGVDIDPEDQKKAIIEAMNQGHIKVTAASRLLEELERTGGRGTNIDDTVDIINFVKIDSKADKQSDETIEQLLSDYQKAKEVSQLKKGDLILYYDVSKEGNLFQRWEIITDFDENTKLPIVAHRQTNGRINPRVVRIDNIKSIGLQIKPFSSGNLFIEGRENLYLHREKVLDKYLNERQLLFDKDAADDIVNKKNASLKAGAKVKYESVPVEWDPRANRFTYKTLQGNNVHPEGRSMYKIIKTVYYKNKWNQHQGGLKEYQLFSNEIYNPDEFSFDQISKASRYGTKMYIKQKLTNGKVKYYEFFVEKAYDGKIKGKVIYEKEENGQIVHKSFPKEIYKNSAVETEIKELYNADWKILNTEARNPERKGRSISQLKKSEYLEMFKKSRDNRNEITSAANRISELYGVKVNTLSNEDMMSLGSQLEIDLSTARGLAHNNEIYINVDKASTAEALHEMGHLVFPGLMAMNPKLWEAIKNKVTEHPVYNIIAEKYSTLSENDLAEETFMTIFGEYYRNVLLETDSFDWHSNNKAEFYEFIKNTSEVVGDIFEMDDLKGLSDTELMNLSLDQIMMQFGNAMMNGSLNVYFKQSRILTSNSQMQKIYEKLRDSGKIETMC